MNDRRRMSSQAAPEAAGRLPETDPQIVVPGRTTARVDDVAAMELTRRRLRDGPLEAIPPDEVIGPRLLPAELVVAVRHHARVDCHPTDAAPRSMAGDVYLTSMRLILAGDDDAAWELGLIREADVTDRQLLLVLGDGTGIALTVDRPASLRVKVQAARQGRVTG
jgi:hypothetical protein